MKTRPVEVEEALVQRMEEFVRKSEGLAPVSVESLTNMAVEAFLEGAGE
jgi:hypothetical protein